MLHVDSGGWNCVFGFVAINIYTNFAGATEPNIPYQIQPLTPRPDIFSHWSFVKKDLTWSKT